MARMFQKKDKFAALDGEFKEEIAGSDEAGIRDRLAKITLDQAAIEAFKAEDADLKIKQEAASEAGAIYREAKKMNKLRIEWCRQVLGDKGKPNGESGLE